MNIILWGENSYLLAFSPNLMPFITMKLTERVGAASEESRPLRSAWIYFCTFQLFIMTRMFNGLIETTMKTGYIYLKQIPHTSNNQKATFMGPSPGTTHARNEVQAFSLFFSLLCNSICCLQFTDTHSKPSFVNSETPSLEILPITPLRIFTQGLFAMLRNLSSF